MRPLEILRRALVGGSRPDKSSFSEYSSVIRTLLDASREISEEGSGNVLYIVRSLAELFEAKYLCIHLLDSALFSDDTVGQALALCPIKFVPPSEARGFAEAEANLHRESVSRGEAVAVRDFKARSPEFADLAERLRFEGGISLPLIYRGMAFGAVNIYTARDRVFDALDLAAIRMLGALIYGSIRRELHVGEVARRDAELNKEIEVAHLVQERILPRKCPEISGLSFFVRYIPAPSICGDFYCVRELPDGRAGVLIVDIAGHGARAAMTAMVVKSVFEELSAGETGPGELLSRMNGCLIRLIPGTLATACYLVFDPGGGKVNYASAGHPHPFLLGKNGGVSALDSRGPIIGAIENVNANLYEETEVKFGEGDAVVLYTDGIYRWPDDKGKTLGIEALGRVVSEKINERGEVLVDGIIARNFAGGTSQLDDIVVMVVEFTPTYHNVPIGQRS
ncbi:MAG: PP2C family protein-serine/threonine phosphatase [bacterium]